MKRMNQKGAVSILSVVIFATIITVVATAYIRTVVNQQTQALQYDFSTRAYYAAESGTQDAVQSLRGNASLALNGRDKCLDGSGDVLGRNSNGDTVSFGQIGGSSDIVASYTCQLIDPSPSSITGDVGPQKNANIRLDTTKGNKVKLTWHLLTPTNNLTQPQTNNGLFQSQGDWDSNQPPVMRVAGFIANDAVSTQNVSFLKPTTTPNAHPLGFQNRAGLTTPGQTDEQLADTLVTQVHCDVVSEAYECSQIIDISNNLKSDQFYLRLHSLYASAEFTVSLLKDDLPVPLTSTAVKVEATGKAGSSLKRVSQFYPINNGFSYDTIPDAAVGAGSICKLYSLGTLGSQFNGTAGCFN